MDLLMKKSNENRCNLGLHDTSDDCMCLHILMDSADRCKEFFESEMSSIMSKLSNIIDFEKTFEVFGENPTMTAIAGLSSLMILRAFEALNKIASEGGGSVEKVYLEEKSSKISLKEMFNCTK
jgi:hypothetical protein